MRAVQTAASVTLPLMVAGCIPQVPHGPRIEAGTRYTLTGAVAHVPSVQGEQFAAIPSMFAGGVHGWAGEDMAASVGLQLPVFALPIVFLAGEDLDDVWRIMTADVYVQPVRGQPDGIDFGVGALVTPGMAVPYVQVGTTGDGGIYTTQAAGFTFGSSFDRTLYWMPTVSHRSVRSDGRRVVDFFAHGLVGWYRRDIDETRRDWAVGVGVQIEFVRPR